MLHTIVEGEPGIFPDPVARAMRAIGGWFDRRRSPEPRSDDPTTPSAPSSSPEDDAPPPDGGDPDESR